MFCRCDLYVGDNAPLPADSNRPIYDAGGPSLYDKRCNSAAETTSFNCFDRCYFGETSGPNSFIFPEVESECDSDTEPFWGVACSGRC